MRTSFAGLFVVLTLVCTCHPVYAQTNISLDIQLYARLSVTGEVGRVYQVQYATELSETNTWYALQHFELKWNPHEFVDTTCPATEKRFYRAVEVEVPTNVVPVANMVFIPPGTFMMGSPTNEAERDNDEIQHYVTISRGFWMGKYEVTQGEYLEVVGDNPSWFTNGATPLHGGTGGPVTNELLHPVEDVDWFDAANYSTLLTERERAAGRLPLGYEYQLPTEAQWEYACRAGTTTAFHYGPALRSEMANFHGQYEYPPCGEDRVWCCNPAGTYLGRTIEVASYEPNAWGLHDMHGNVLEWCRDWYGAYPGGSVTDPTGPAAGSARVFRGGRWPIDARGCRSASRSWWNPEIKDASVGFRVALVSVP